MVQADERRTIAVRGVGTVTVVPDTAVASIGAVITDQAIINALRQVDQRMNSVIGGLKANGIPDNQIKTIKFDVSVARDYQNPRRPIIGYTVSHIMRVSVSPSVRIGEVISSAIDSGANDIDSIRFTTADANAAGVQARSLAMVDALSRARQIAADANLELGDPLRIVEGEVDVPEEPRQYMMLAESRSAPVQQIEAGQQEIEVTVTVVFEAHSRSA